MPIWAKLQSASTNKDKTQKITGRRIQSSNLRVAIILPLYCRSFGLISGEAYHGPEQGVCYPRPSDRSASMLCCDGRRPQTKFTTSISCQPSGDENYRRLDPLDYYGKKWADSKHGKEP